jgi:pseudaminic acid biosynthesis-associated methylase
MSVPNAPRDDAEARRLEALWQGSFGDEYTERNAAASEGRLPFWKGILDEYRCRNVLEVGCNLGANLRWITTLVEPRDVYGVDLNERALSTLRTSHPAVNAVWSPARELPFRDRFFDLVFTMGVLIHQPLETLPDVMSEIVRCSRRYVLAGEYHADELTEVPYRGERAALFKQDFGRRYMELFPDLKLLKRGFLPRGSGWDDTTYWVFERGR